MNRHPLLIPVLVIGVLLSGALWLGQAAARPIQFAEFTNGQEAALVLGQDDFLTGADSVDWGDNRFQYPRVVAVDPATGKVFVADTNNNRVLRFDSFDALSNGASAEMVFGQSDFTSYNSTRTRSGLSSPRGLAVYNGNLYVADSNNSRIVRYNNASTVQYSGTAPQAQQLIGQNSYTTDQSPSSRTLLNDPWGLKFDQNGNLYITEYTHNRILRVNNAESRGNTPRFDAVFGQPDYTSTSSGAGAAQLYIPHDVAIDDNGNLFVADTGNQRILMFSNAATLSGGGHAADLAIGQPDPATVDTSSDASASRVMNPKGVLLDSNGNLWVSDAVGRVLRFPDAANSVGGGTADLVLGKPDFTTITTPAFPALPPASASDLVTPFGIAADSAGTLYVTDQNANRVVAFRGTVPPQTPTPVAESTAASCTEAATLEVLPDPLEITAGGAATVWVELRNPCRDLPTAPADALLSLSDGLTVIETSQGVLNLGQRAALQRFSLGAGETLGWYAIVRAAEVLPTAPLAIAEIYAGSAVVRTDELALTVPAAAAPAPAVVQPEPVAAPAVPEAAAPLPTALPNTAAGGQAGIEPWLVGSVIAGLVLGGLLLARRRQTSSAG